MSNQSTKTQYLSESLFEWLEEVWQEYNQGNKSEFLLGEIYAYVECLEVLLRKQGVDNDTLLAIEEHYGIR